MDVMVTCKNRHYDRRVRRHRNRGEHFQLNGVEARRRARQDLVEIDAGVPPEVQLTPSFEKPTAPVGEVTPGPALEVQIPDPLESKITAIGGGRYRIEGLEKSVRGKQAALEAAAAIQD